ncbi:MAG TPA: hypothetical protein VJB89_02940 [Candidatus Nanoarchaeia archaeon]|nr:hypothetical protein [Candidatus Nanoarchaeia archaeon]
MNKKGEINEVYKKIIIFSLGLIILFTLSIIFYKIIKGGLG